MKAPISHYKATRALPFSIVSIILGGWFLSMPYTVYHLSYSMFRDNLFLMWPVGAIGVLYLISTSIFSILNIAFFRGIAIYKEKGKLAISQPFSIKIDIASIVSVDSSTIIGSYDRVKISMKTGRTFYISPFLTDDTCESLILKIRTLKVKIA